MIKECGTDKEKRNLIFKDQVFNTLEEEPEFECRDEFVSEKGNMVLPKVGAGEIDSSSVVASMTT